MPPSACSGDRARIEAALPPQVRAALAETCAVLSIPMDRWHRVDAVARVFGQVATEHLAQHLVEAHALAPTEALRIAAERLGISPDTAMSRSRRWHLAAYR